MGHSRKHPYHLDGGNRKFNLPTPFRCPNTFTIIRNMGGVWIFSGTWGSMDLFWNDPMPFPAL